MALTAPPAAPDITDPDTFEARAQAWVLWAATFVSELNAVLGVSIPAGSAAAATLTGDTLASSVAKSSIRFINETSNADNTNGLTITQTANDQIESYKNTSVTHGVTGVAETDTFGYKQIYLPASGGMTTVGISSDIVGQRLIGIQTVGDTAKSNAMLGAVIIEGSLKSGVNVADCGANANILVVRNRMTARFSLDADGDAHQDVGTAWTNFDDHEDVDLLTALSVHVSQPGDAIKDNFAQFLTYNRKRLEELGLVTFNENGHHFVNWSRIKMLLIGAVRQQANKAVWQEMAIKALKTTVQEMREQLAQLMPPGEVA